MAIRRDRIRFLEQVPNNDGYRRYLRDCVRDWVREDPHGHNLEELAVAAIIRDGGHTSTDRRSHCVVDFYYEGDDGTAKHLVTQHVLAISYKEWKNSS